MAKKKEWNSESGYAEALRRIDACRKSGDTRLNLAYLSLLVLPPEIGDLRSLSYLNLDGNQLSTLPSTIEHLSALASLSIRYNKQPFALPSAIGELRGLGYLYLNGSQVGTLPPEIGCLVSLKRLFLYSNHLTTLPPELGRLVSLIHLSMPDNRLLKVPPEFDQLNQLQYCDVRYNRLTTIPSEFSGLEQLRNLLVWGNPLPSEVLKLSGGKEGKGTKLIRWLRSRCEVEASAAPESLKRFDEAKLLLVGPGNVGKTWLLQALQGRVPKKVETTKGIEIAREPLELPHPTESGRTLHMTCWDFGGQEPFQITHQIFFSAKAVYLLVWKPRDGFDPEMESRLERIQLSAGETAKVLIVSTHADGKNPAQLGQDALRERFGDLIWGFYEIDSEKGPKGTGIAELKLQIALAAAQLRGMDEQFLSSWHAAQRQIRKIAEPAIPMKRLIAECRELGLEPEDAEIVAVLMEDQGHAVYFPDAAEDEDAGALADDNLIVLNPEWLAKAVGLVIEDKKTVSDQGILRHERLADIWKKDKKRDSLGYKKELHGYLLWLMWQFDIAYKQDAQTSLVPELIARNRPDLLWHPQTECQTREVRTVCVFTSEQTRKMIESPKGLIPALTAAVHPLRQRRDHDDPDKLDRNWNNGFFLNTQSRGDAYVELVDRELRIVVRHGHPKLLLDQILCTLNEIVPQRWPHAVVDLRVPCLGKIDNKPCPGIFKVDWLRRQTRNSLIRCQECNSGRLKVSDLLEGFDWKEDELLARLRELKDGQRDLLAVAHSIFLGIDPENMERRRAPSLFTILPDKGKWHQNLAHKHVRLTCWCEHPDGPHPATPIGSEQPPDYLLKIPKDWLIKASPYISWGVTLLKAFIPLAGTGVGQVAAGSGIDIKDSLALMKDISSALPSGKLEIGEGREFELMPGERWGTAYGRTMKPELIALRHIHDLLEEQIPKPKRWGELKPVQTKSGEILWLCPKHAEIQSPSPQQL